MAWTMKYQTPNNHFYPKFQTKDSTFGTSKLQIPNNFAYLKLQTPNKHISIPIPKVKEFPPVGDWTTKFTSMEGNYMVPTAIAD